MAEEKPYYQYCPAEFALRTIGFNYLERALYRELLEKVYLLGPLPPEEYELAALCGWPLKTFERAYKKVQTRFVLTDMVDGQKGEVISFSRTGFMFRDYEDMYNTFLS